MSFAAHTVQIWGHMSRGKGLTGWRVYAVMWFWRCVKITWFRKWRTVTENHWKPARSRYYQKLIKRYWIWSYTLKGSAFSYHLLDLPNVEDLHYWLPRPPHIGLHELNECVQKSGGLQQITSCPAMTLDVTSQIAKRAHKGGAEPMRLRWQTLWQLRKVRHTGDDRRSDAKRPRSVW